MQNECQSGTSGRFVVGHLQIVGDIERSIRQRSSKMMKLKGFWYTGGYCLSSKARTQLSKRENFFSFWRPESDLKGKTWKKLSS
jgi:hypothetical protein